MPSCMAAAPPPPVTNTAAVGDEVLDFELDEPPYETPPRTQEELPEVAAAAPLGLGLPGEQAQLLQEEPVQVEEGNQDDEEEEEEEEEEDSEDDIELITEAPRLSQGNIVLDEGGNPKLCGLGPRPSLHHEAAFKSDLSVVRYFGPEKYLAESTLPDKATDVWAFGCLIMKILTGHDPFREARTTYGVIRAVTSGQRPYERLDCDNLQLWHMASSCWTEGLLQRPVATSLAVRIGKIPTEM
ncbi:hypothetical protein FRC09_009865 [Ceratobasidium sp. 395]|nr:hypothetical protein FRC09_009865 [Ceratobasidium sp. 395]